jgi:hypothetical protein
MVNGKRSGRTWLLQNGSIIISNCPEGTAELLAKSDLGLAVSQLRLDLANS